MVLDAGYLGTKGTGLATGRRQWTAVARGWYGCLHHSAPNRQDAERPLAATGLRDHYPVHRPAEHRNVCGGAHDLRVDPLEEDEFARRHSRACLANSALPPITVGKSLRTRSRKLRADHAPTGSRRARFPGGLQLPVCGRYFRRAMRQSVRHSTGTQRRTVNSAIEAQLLAAAEMN